MEVLQWAGIPTILFLAPPDHEQLDSFPRFEAFGVAGSSRSLSRSQMESELTPIFRRLCDSGAKIVHYKTCSTFDSSPEIGSVGKAIEIGREVFAQKVVPILIAAPNLGRYQVFGNLFARSGLDTEPFRLDRHPTMMHHPITPMNESDMRIHLAAQTSLRLGLCDILQLNGSHSCEEILANSEKNDVVLFDGLFPEHLAKIGSILHRMTIIDSPSFVVGSSGIEYALTAFWAGQSEIVHANQIASNRPTFGPVDQLVVITGSCSPVNDRQITWAEQNGFETLPINASRLIDDQTCQLEVDWMMDRALKQLKSGKNLILHTSRGPNDPRMATTLQAMRAMGLSELEIRLQSGKILGPKLGKILKEILAERSFLRVGVAGGDTSGFIARELGLTALEAIAPVAPGSPLCRAFAQNSMDGIEFIFKGGQVGKDDVWGTILHGTPKI